MSDPNDQRREDDLRVPADAELRAAQRATAGGDGIGDVDARGWLMRVALLLAVGLVLVALVARPLLVDPVFAHIDMTMPPGVHTLVIGASHAACALDPDALGESASGGRTVSVARHGELLVSTHAKLAALLRDNPDVRRVLLTFAPIHVAGWQDEHLLGGNAHSRTQLMEYYPLFDERTRAQLPGWQADVLLARLKYDWGVPFDLTDDAALYARELSDSLTPWQRRIWGGFTPLTGSHLHADLLELVDQRYFRDGEQVVEVSARAERALERIVETTRDAGVQLVLLDTPVHASFAALVPERHRAAHDALLDALAESAPEVLVLRHADLALPDESFLDPDHLNAAGAEQYTAMLVAVLDEHAASTDG